MAFAMLSGNEACIDVEPLRRTSPTRGAPIQLRWSCPSPVSDTSEVAVYVGSSPEPSEVEASGRLVAVFKASAGQGVIEDPFGGLKRPFVLLKPRLARGVGKARGVLTADRHIILDGGGNLRDLGGYATRDQKHVRYGVLFRHGALDRLSEGDRQLVASLGIRTRVDFRGPQEKRVEAIGDAATAFDLPIISLAGFLPRLMQGLREGDISFLDESFLATAMRGLASPAVDDTFRAFLALACDPQRLPLAFQCTAGKDRTGWAAALLLNLLGVSSDDVEADYLLTNELYGPIADAYKVRFRKMAEDAGHAGMDLSPLDNALWVSTAALAAGYDAAEGCCGSFEAYTTEALGVGDTNRAALRAACVV